MLSFWIGVIIGVTVGCLVTFLYFSLRWSGVVDEGDGHLDEATWQSLLGTRWASVGQYTIWRREGGKALSLQEQAKLVNEAFQPEYVTCSRCQNSFAVGEVGPLCPQCSVPFSSVTGTFPSMGEVCQTE